MRAKFIPGLLLLLLFSRDVCAQADSLLIEKDMERSQALMLQGRYDSALYFGFRALEIVKTKKLASHPYSSALYNQIGSVYRLSRKAEDAQQWLMQGLENARRYHHAVEKLDLLNALCRLHDDIRAYQLPFHYPEIKEKEEVYGYWPVDSIRRNGDSADILIHAGMLDGLFTDGPLPEIYTRNILHDTSDHQSVQFYNKGRYVYLDNNRCRIRVLLNPSLRLLPGDMAGLKLQIPLSWQDLRIRDFLLRSITFTGNENQIFYNYRFFYYYASPALEEDVLESMQHCVQEVAEFLAEDTLTNPVYAEKTKKGMFAGKNMMRAMIETTSGDIGFYTGFVNTYPGKYAANRFKFSETYATWVINNAILSPDDLKKYLLGFATGKLRQQAASLYQQQMQEDKQISHWLDENLRLITAGWIPEAQSMTALVEDATAGCRDSLNAGWPLLLHALLAQMSQDTKQAEHFLNEAHTAFRLGNNAEGLQWVESILRLWEKSPEIQVGIQTGHAFPYKLARSPDPRFIATGGLDNLVKIWDLELGREIKTLIQAGDEIVSLAYSPNGRYLAAASADSSVFVCNAFTKSIIRTYKTNGAVHAITFSPDNQWLLTAEDSVINYREWQSGKTVRTLTGLYGTVNDLCFDPDNGDMLFSAQSDSTVRKWNTETGESVRWFRHSGPVLFVQISPDHKYMSAVSTDSVLTIWNLETNRKRFRQHIQVTRMGNLNYYSCGDFSADSRYIAWPDSKNSFSVMDLKDGYQRNYKTGLSFSGLGGLYFTNDGQSMLARFDGSGPLRVYNFADWDIRNRPLISWKDIRFYADIPMGIQFAENDSALFIMHSKLSKLDLRNGSESRISFEVSPVESRQLLLYGDSSYLSFALDSPRIDVVQLRHPETSRSFRLPGINKIVTAVTSKYPDRLYAANDAGFIRGWNMLNEQELFSVLLPENNTVYRMFADSFHHQLLVLTESGTLYAMNENNGTQISRTIDMNIEDCIAGKESVYVTTRTGELISLQPGSLEVEKRMVVNTNRASAGQLLLTPDQQCLIVQNSDTTLMAVQTANHEIVWQRSDHAVGETMLAISHDGLQIASAGMDSRIHIYETQTGKRIVSILTPLDKDPVLVDSTGYYLASRNSLDALLFTWNNRAYPFDQFDLQLNRPDRILSALGRAGKQFIQSIRQAYDKRIQQLHLPVYDLQQDPQLPRVRILNKKVLRTITTDSIYTLDVECMANGNPLQKLQVLVNNVPVLGMNGQDISSPGLTVQTVSVPVTVRLSEGDNNIKIFCTDSRGITSIRESLRILSKYQPAKPASVYFIGIAVSEYKDERMNLHYPVKDIRDLAAAFAKIYPGLIVDTLLNKKATRENIQALREKLKRTGINDKVILAVNGHGMLTDSLDFYYATWDMNPVKPEARGIRYEELENLLTDIPARRKLMLIDACHSGSVDKEAVLAVKQDSVKTLSPREQFLQLKQARLEANSSYELMQQLFTDLSPNNGAVIISAAGGMEYAFESGAWNNGVFTYSVLQGLQNGTADLECGDFNGYTTVQELQTYVSKKVQELTQGKQRPVSRRENIEYSWNIGL